MAGVPRTSIETERLRLEPMSGDHLDGLWAAARSSLPELRAWMAWSLETSPERMGAFVRDSEEAWAAGRAYRFAIVHDGEPVGVISVELHERMSHRGEVGYWMRSDLAGRGLTTEAGHAVVGFAFGQLRLHRLDLSAGTGNPASQRVAEKLGFRREGLARNGSSGEGGFHDVYTYGLLETDPRGPGRR
ncbi:MAG TPA: GNAT family protein [Actinomycetota bacterium]|nr:GNAT family protein [Actinomycetota bacterium]